MSVNSRKMSRKEREEAIRSFLLTPEMQACKWPRTSDRSETTCRHPLRDMSNSGLPLHQDGGLWLGEKRRDGGLWPDECLQDKIEREHEKAKEYQGKIVMHDNMMEKDKWEPFDEASVSYIKSLLSTAYKGDEDFYIGICCSPADRWSGNGNRGCHSKEWSKMIVVAAGDGPEVAKLEKKVLETARYQLGCQNKAPGGQRPAPRGVQSFLYVVVPEFLD